MGKNDKNNKPRGRAKKTVVLVLSLVLIIALAVVAFRFRSHIKAVYIWLTTSDEDIQQSIDKAKDEQTQVLNNSGFFASKELDEALQTGRITAEEHTQILLGSVTLDEVLAKKDEPTEVVPDVSEKTETPKETDAPENDGETDKHSDKPNPPSNGTYTETPDGNQADDTVLPPQNVEKPNDDKEESEKIPQQNIVTPDAGEGESNKPNAPPAQQTQPTADADKRIAELVTKMYVLKSEYTGAVEGVVASMKAEYSLLPKEQRTLASKQRIASGYLGTINAMEAQCDAQVNAIVSELRQLLKANGRDMALADAILSTYATEKENTKAYYLSTYGD